MIKLIESIVGLLGKVVDRVPKHSTEDAQTKAQRGMAEGLARDASSRKTAEREWLLSEKKEFTRMIKSGGLGTEMEEYARDHLAVIESRLKKL